MMGTHELQKDLFSYQVELDKRVRDDHPLRQVNQVMDWSWVRGEVKDCYGYNGNVSVDPVQVMKLMFLLLPGRFASGQWRGYIRLVAGEAPVNNADSAKSPYGTPSAFLRSIC